MFFVDGLPIRQLWQLRFSIFHKKHLTQFKRVIFFFKTSNNLITECKNHFLTEIIKQMLLLLIWSKKCDRFLIKSFLSFWSKICDQKSLCPQKYEINFEHWFTWLNFNWFFLPCKQLFKNPHCQFVFFFKTNMNWLSPNLDFN